MCGWFNEASALRFALESRDVAGIVSQGRGENLQRHFASEFGVAAAIYLAHPARAKQSDDLIRTDACSDRYHFRAAAKAPISRASNGRRKMATSSMSPT